MSSAPTDAHVYFQWFMERAHDAFKAGFDSILSHLDKPPLDDLPNFLGYCQSWAEAIAEHHDSEEVVFFPVLSAKLDMSSEIEQHRVLHVSLDAFLAYIASVKKDLASFDAAKLRSLMNDLRGPLYEHLDDEVADLSPEKLKDKFSAAELHDILKKTGDYAKANADPWTGLPFMRSHTPPEYKPLWPGMPWVLTKVLIPHVFARRHSGYWKYAPYATS
ncbi:hypothetical protein PLICRDRAFT_34703 [Plicaturopsis crispa FD-325 SS-3]|nr:hypothetical protein PLICRDRAFT_34703 [Plicaturopsis crispa FD-325 SS-3]